MQILCTSRILYLLYSHTIRSTIYLILNLISTSPQTEHIFIRNFDYIEFGSISFYNTADILILGLTKRVYLVSQDS